MKVENKQEVVVYQQPVTAWACVEQEARKHSTAPEASKQSLRNFSYGGLGYHPIGDLSFRLKSGEFHPLSQTHQSPHISYSLEEMRALLVFHKKQTSDGDKISAQKTEECAFGKSTKTPLWFRQSLGVPL